MATVDSVLTSHFGVRAAQSFIDFVGNHGVYQVVGKPLAWNDDNNPPDVGQTYADDEFTFWNTHLLAGVKINQIDTAHVVPRIDWTGGTVYSVYDPSLPTSDLFSSNFYVLTDDNNIYKVIENNGNSASTAKPTSTIADIFETSDGYKWKYLYTIDSSEQSKFLTADFMPVHNNTNNTDTDENAGNGNTPFPPGGHGADNLHELNARHICISVSIENDENQDFFQLNDYRKTGILVDPISTDTDSVATEPTRRQTTEITLSGSSFPSFELDETVSDGINTGKVIYQPSNNMGLLYVVMTSSGTFDSSSTLTGQSSGASNGVDSVSGPELKNQTGKIIQVSHLDPVTRAEQQQETFRTIIQF